MPGIEPANKGKPVPPSGPGPAGVWAGRNTRACPKSLHRTLALQLLDSVGEEPEGESERAWVDEAGQYLDDRSEG